MEKPIFTVPRVTILFAAAAMTMGLVTCSSNSASTSANSEPDNQSRTIEPRGEHEPILGNVSGDGACDPTVIDINHERPTAHVTYHGKPGDEIEVIFVFHDEDRTAEHQHFTLKENMTEMQIPSNIENAAISRIDVVAQNGNGIAGSCFIKVA